MRSLLRIKRRRIIDVANSKIFPAKDIF